MCDTGRVALTRPAGQADITLYAGETRWVEVPIYASHDVIFDPVAVAFVPLNMSPEAEDFVTAEWTPGQTWVDSETPLIARVLVGPNGGAITLDPGTYDVIAALEDNPEDPWTHAGVVRIR